MKRPIWLVLWFVVIFGGGLLWGRTLVEIPPPSEGDWPESRP